jgi:hypothetical protein
VLPVDHVVTDPLAEERLNLQGETFALLTMVGRD